MVRLLFLLLLVRPVAAAEDPALRAATDQLILPAMGDFVVSVEALNQIATDYCVAPESNRLAQSREAWRVMMNRWQYLYPMLFGPMEMGELETPALQIDSRLMRGRSYDRVVRAIANSTIAGEAPITDDTVMEMMFKFKGVHAVEFLLFEQPVLELMQQQFVAEPRRCDLLLAYIHDIAAVAGPVEMEWIDVESSTFPGSDIGRNNFVNKILEIVIFATKRKLIPGKAGGDSLESRLSGNSLENVRQMLRGSQDALMILLQSDRVQRGTDNRSVEQKLARQFDVVFSQMEQIGNLEQANKDNRTGVESLIDEIIVLEKIVKHEALAALGVKQGFNFNDGD